MNLTGRADGPPVAPPPGVVNALDDLAASLVSSSAELESPIDVDWAELLMVRAKLLGLGRRGRVSAGGACRLLQGDDGFLAVNLSRSEDVAAVDAIVGRPAGSYPWDALEESIAQTSVQEVAAKARLLGVPAAPLPRLPQDLAPRVRSTHLWPRAGRRPLAALRIIDLSSMWAGPLAAHLLWRAGGHVVKVESTTRPDGGRAIPSFYRTLHDDDQPVETLDFTDAEGRRRLGELLDEADVVIDSSRPRALEQLGAGPEDVALRPGRLWVSITGYGRAGLARDWVAFGDDAAVAGGLVAWESEADPVFLGDAIADPVTGMVAAVATFEALAEGGGALLDVSMQACAASLLSTDALHP